MKYIEGYPIQETAKIIRIPTGTVKSRLSRARKALRCIMESRHYYSKRIIPLRFASKSN